MSSGGQDSFTKHDSTSVAHKDIPEPVLFQAFPNALPDKTSETSTVTLFICTNCHRPGMAPTCGSRQPPAAFPLELSFPAREVRVPCTGKLQPEHLLKAFEAGADLVCVVACDEANCHYLEGSRRAKRRIEYVRELLDEAGIGGDRLLLFHLPGSSKEDMALGSGGAADRNTVTDDAVSKQAGALSDTISIQLKRLGASPLRRNGLSA
jgi:coenzyme F420-reducing hydrogenase delta subunit